MKPEQPLQLRKINRRPLVSPILPRSSQPWLVPPSQPQRFSPELHIKLHIFSLSEPPLPPRPVFSMQMWHLPETFPHNTLTLVGSTESMPFFSFLKASGLPTVWGTFPRKERLNAPSFSPFLPSTLRHNANSSGVCDLCQLILFVLWKSSWGFFFSFFLTFQTVNHVRLSIRDGSQTHRGVVTAKEA